MDELPKFQISITIGTTNYKTFTQSYTEAMEFIKTNYTSHLTQYPKDEIKEMTLLSTKRG